MNPLCTFHFSSLQVNISGWSHTMPLSSSRSQMWAWWRCPFCRAPLPTGAGISSTMSLRSWWTLTSECPSPHKGIGEGTDPQRYIPLPFFHLISVATQEPASRHLYLHSPGHLCLRLRQRGLRHRHVTPGVAGLQCSCSGEAPIVPRC